MYQSATAAGLPPYAIEQPARRTLPLVLNAPHSGASYSESFRDGSRLGDRMLRASEDVDVDALVRPAAELGAPLMRAIFPRAWLDVNREPYELDPKMFAGTLPRSVNTGSVRVAGGLGTIPRIVAEGTEIYRAPLAAAEAIHRIDTVYKPYHRALRHLVEDTRARFGVAVLIDCHSMPSAARRGIQDRPDIVLGDRFGSSCSADLIDLATAVLARLGYRVARNRPYAGGFITEHYGQPGDGRHALQIEINRSLYMNERTYARLPRFTRLQRDFAMLVGELGDALVAGMLAPAEAAE